MIVTYAKVSFILTEIDFKVNFFTKNTDVYNVSAF